MSDRLLALRLFLRVARTGSFSRAAREQDIAQPSASRIIASLEQELGATLFTRTTRGVSVTEAGGEYLKRVEALLDGLEEADYEVRGSGELKGLLRVGVSSALSIRGVIPRLPCFTLAHPSLRVELLVEDGLQDLVAEGVDVALRFGPIPDSSAVARLLAVWPRITLASPEYLSRCGTPKVPADLSAHSIVAASLGTGSGWSFSKDGRAVSIKIDSQFMVNETEAAIAAAVAGLGIISTVLPVVDKELADGRLIRLLPDWSMGTFELNAVFVDGRAAKPSAKAFTEFLKAALVDL